jgi:hypothetical protein
MASSHAYRFGPQEWLLLHSVLNEITHWYHLDDYKSLIGMNKADLEKLLEYLHVQPRQSDITLDATQVNVFCNALRETLKLVSKWEFPTRTGYSIEEAQNILQKLDQLIANAP